MTLKRWVVCGTISSILLLGACSDTEKEEAVEPEKKIEEKKPEKVAQADVKNEEDEEKEKEEEQEEVVEEDEAESGDILNPYIAEVTGGEVQIVSMDSKPNLKHEFDDKVSLEIAEYQIVHVTNMNESAHAEFQGENEGYVLTYKMILTNNLAEDVYFNASSMLLADDGHENLYMKGHFVNRDDWMKGDSSEFTRQYSKGESYTGMQAYAMTKEQFDRLAAPTLTISQPFLNDDTGKMIGKPAVFKLPVSKEGVDKAAASAALYNDKMVTDSIADKKLLFSKEDIDLTKKIDEVNITLHGVQFTEVIPTEGHASRFSGFGDGPIIALTAKITLENNSDVAFSKFLIDKKINFKRADNSAGMMRSEGMLEPSVRGDMQPGDKEEMLAVFLFREAEFDQLKNIQLEIGPLKDDKAKPLYKESTVTFNLPPIK